MSQKASRKEYLNFTLVMLIFTIGMIVMLFYKIENYWIWIAYITAWTWIEMKIAKNIHLKWWVWLLIILGLCGLDLLIIQLLH